MNRYRGQHRKPATTGRTLTRAALAGAAAAAPLLVAAPAAHAADNSTWDRVAQCESGGNWAINTGNGFQGGLQFTPSTWTGFGGGQFASSANYATRGQQIVVAERVLAQQGWGAWPVCSRNAGATSHTSSPRPTFTHATAPALLAPAVPQQQARLSAAPSGNGNYIVKVGDTLSGIASAHQVRGSWPALAATNPTIAAHPNLIFPGQRLTL